MKRMFRWIGRSGTLALVLVGVSGCGTLPTESDEEGDFAISEPHCPGLSSDAKVLVDASHDGGVWWFPQSSPSFNEAEPHQGKRLADHLRARGFQVDELARGVVVTDSILRQYRTVIRAGAFGSYGSGELDAYQSYLSCDATLVLLGEFLRDGWQDPLAEMMGLSFGGLYTGVVVDFEVHDITAGIGLLPYIGGSALQSYDESKVTVLGSLQGLPVMGTLDGNPARVFFMGDTNSLLTVPQPLVDNLIAWGF